MNQILHGEPMSIFGDGSQSRGFSYIEEVAPPIAASVLYSGAAQEAFFVGTDAKYSVRQHLRHECPRGLGPSLAPMRYNASRELSKTLLTRPACAFT